MLYKGDNFNKKDNGIYKISNTIDNRIYIGIATNFYKRYGRHFYQLRANKHFNRKLQNFVNKYGIDKLIFEPVEVINDKRLLIQKEIAYIIDNDSINNGFNLILDSSKMSHIPKHLIIKARKNRKGVKMTEEQKKNISEGKKKQYKLFGHHYLGKKLSEETKKKMSEAHKRRVSLGISFLKNRKVFGDNHHRSKLTEDLVKLIKLDIKNNLKPKTILEKYNIKYHHLRNIRDERSWKHIKV